MVNLTIGGGSFKGLAFLGSLEYLHSQNYLELIENFHGASIGSLIGIMYIIGYKPVELFEILLGKNFEELWDLSFQNLDRNYSLLSTSFFEYFESIFSKRENNIDITIEQFYNKYDVNINIYSVSINNRSIVNFNRNTFPELKVVTAIRASCSIPIIFPPVKINDIYYIDGCIKSIQDDNILPKDRGYIIRLNQSYDEIDSFTGYISEIVKCILINNEIKTTKNTLDIELNSGYSNKISFNDITESDKIQLFYEGLIQAKTRFETI